MNDCISLVESHWGEHRQMQTAAQSSRTSNAINKTQVNCKTCMHINRQPLIMEVLLLILSNTSTASRWICSRNWTCTNHYCFTLSCSSFTRLFSGQNLEYKPQTSEYKAVWWHLSHGYSHCMVLNKSMQLRKVMHANICPELTTDMARFISAALQLSNLERKLCLKWYYCAYFPSIRPWEKKVVSSHASPLNIKLKAGINWQKLSCIGENSKHACVGTEVASVGELWGRVNPHFLGPCIHLLYVNPLWVAHRKPMWPHGVQSLWGPE